MGASGVARASPRKGGNGCRRKQNFPASVPGDDGELTARRNLALTRSAGMSKIGQEVDMRLGGWGS